MAYLDVPSYDGCFPGLGLLFSSSFPITACFTVKGLGGMAELCFRALVTSQRKSVQRVGNTEHGTLAWAAGSRVSQHWCLVLGPSRMQGLEQKPRDASRVTGSKGSKWKDQPWGCRQAAPRGQEFSSQGDCVRRAPGDTGTSLRTPSVLTVCTPARCENYHSSSRGCTWASRSLLRSLRGECTASLSNTSGIWSKIQRIN